MKQMLHVVSRDNNVINFMSNFVTFNRIWPCLFEVEEKESELSVGKITSLLYRYLILFKVFCFCLFF